MDFANRKARKVGVFTDKTAPEPDARTRRTHDCWFGSTRVLSKTWYWMPFCSSEMTTAHRRSAWTLRTRKRARSASLPTRRSPSSCRSNASPEPDARTRRTHDCWFGSTRVLSKTWYWMPLNDHRAQEVGMDFANRKARKVGVFTDKTVAQLLPMQTLPPNRMPARGELTTAGSVRRASCQRLGTGCRSALAKEHDFSHFLAVGGGSVIGASSHEEVPASEILTEEVCVSTKSSM
jgi:hypothetical protein